MAKTLAILVLFCILFCISITTIFCGSDDDDNDSGQTGGTVATPVISPGSGTYSDDIMVTITCETADAIIYYTTDGSDPSTNSTSYSSPFQISGNGTTWIVRAIAVKSGMDNSAEASATYSILYENTFFIDPSATASGNGSFDSPFRGWADVTFEPGYYYLQKRGTISREQIDVDIAATEGSPIVIGAYGEGEKPVIQGSEIQTGWGLEYDNIYSKNVSTGSGRLGMIAEDGQVLKSVQWQSDEATTLAHFSSGSFSFDDYTDTMYVWCSDGATPDSHSMEASIRSFGVHGNYSSWITIQGIHIRYMSTHGIAFESSQYITIKECIIEKLGGSIVLPEIQAGNGIEFSNTSSHCLVQDCVIEDIFDSGISPQIFDGNQHASDFRFFDCTISRCGLAGVEIMLLYDPAWTNCSIRDIVVRNMTISDCGKGWSGNRYDGAAGRGIIAGGLVGDNSRSISGLTIENCSITGSAGEGVFIFGKSGLVTISRCSISGSGRDGILFQELESTDLKLFLNSSLIFNNGYGSEARNGLFYNVTDGAGYILYHNTFYNNNQCSFLVWEHTGAAELINNLFHASEYRAHFATAYFPPESAVFNNNFFTEFEPNPIIALDIADSPIYYSNAESFNNAHSFAQNNISDSNPLLSADLSLQSQESPCFQQGASSTGVTKDYEGNDFRDPPSIGAYEYW